VNPSIEGHADGYEQPAVRAFALRSEGLRRPARTARDGGCEQGAAVMVDRMHLGITSTLLDRPPRIDRRPYVPRPDAVPRWVSWI
jgi:hypothetical protein